MGDIKTEYDKLFIGGRWTEPSTSEVIEVHCPATGEYVGKVPMAAAADVDAAVAAARAAFDSGPWPTTPPKERAAVIANALKLMEERKDGFTKLLGLETGQPPTSVETMQWMSGIGAMNFFAGPAVDQVKWQEIRNGGYGQTIVHREPLGVVGAIVAWNVPLFLAINKLGPALLAGCTVVLKPAAETPLSANAFAEVFAEAGLPEGVLSVVPGGVETGQALTSNRDIDVFSFTGSSAVGKEIGRRAAELLKPCTLELGGKSAAILLDDVDLAASIPMLVFSGIMNTGQACVAQTRILAPRSRYDEIVDAVSAFVQALPVGTPTDPAAQIGSLISEKQRARVEGYIAKGIEEGARLVCGGGRPEGLENGFFVQPTVFRRRRQQDDDRPGGDLRAGAVHHPLRHRGGRDQDRQRLGVRPGRQRVDHQRAARHRDLGEDPHRDVRDQLVRLRSLLPVRRIQELRHRPRERAGGCRALHPAEERADADGLHGRQLRPASSSWPRIS